MSNTSLLQVAHYNLQLATIVLNSDILTENEYSALAAMHISIALETAIKHHLLSEKMYCDNIHSIPLLLAYAQHNCVNLGDTTFIKENEYTLSKWRSRDCYEGRVKVSRDTAKKFLAEVSKVIESIDALEAETIEY